MRLISRTDECGQDLAQGASGVMPHSRMQRVGCCVARIYPHTLMNKRETDLAALLADYLDLLLELAEDTAPSCLEELWVAAQLLLEGGEALREDDGLALEATKDALDGAALLLAACGTGKQLGSGAGLWRSRRVRGNRGEQACDGCAVWA